MLLIVWHSRTGASRALAEAAAGAAGDQVKLVAAADAVPEHFLAARGYLFACPENLGTMSGMMKEMFDRCYYPLLGQIEGRAYASMIAAGSDGRGAQAQLDRIVTGWRLRRIAPPLIANLGAQTADEIAAPKVVSHSLLSEAADLGAGMASGLEQRIF